MGEAFNITRPHCDHIHDVDHGCLSWRPQRRGVVHVRRRGSCTEAGEMPTDCLQCPPLAESKATNLENCGTMKRTYKILQEQHRITMYRCVQVTFGVWCFEYFSCRFQVVHPTWDVRCLQKQKIWKGSSRNILELAGSLKDLKSIFTESQVPCILLYLDILPSIQRPLNRYVFWKRPLL